MRGKRKDANHNAVAAYLRKLGFSVLDTSALGRGFPDCVVGCPGFAAVVEIKSDPRISHRKRGELTKPEQRVRKLWTGPYVLALSEQDAAEQLLALKRGWHG